MTHENHQGEARKQIDLREYWKLVLKHRWTVLAFTLVTVTLVTIFTLRQTKIYEASASVIIEPYAPQVLGNVREVYSMGVGSYLNNKEYYETQFNVITSRTIAQEVVGRLGLEGNKEFLGIDRLPIDEQNQVLNKPIDYTEEVREMLEVEQVKDSRATFIKVRHRYPQWAKRLADAIVDVYIDHNRQTRQQVTRDAAGWLGTQVAELKGLMNEAEDKLIKFKRDKKMLSVSLEDSQNITSQRLMDLNQSLNRMQAERIALEGKRDQIVDIRESRLPLDTVDKVIGNNLIQQLKENYFKLKEHLTELGTKYLPEHPKYMAVQKKVKLIRRTIDREIDNVLASLEAEYQAKLKSERTLKKELAKVKAEAQDINEKEIEYNRLKRVADNYASMYKLITTRQKEVTLASHQETNNIYRLDAAVEPRLPVHPRVKLNILLAAVAGLLGGIGLAFFREYLDNTIKTQEDVERYLGVPFLGVIPSIKVDSERGSHKKGKNRQKIRQGDGLVQRDHYLVSHPKSSMAECCRTVRTNLLFMSPENPARRLLITSTGPQEGKSTVSISLGITMAQSGSKVVLVDTDMRRPRLHKSFGIDMRSGLSTAILGEAETSQIAYPSGVPGLDIVPCGPIPPNPTELFHTERFKKIVQQLSGMYDRVIFDSPPVAMVADPLILSSMMDGVVLVIKGASTSRVLMQRVIKQFRDVKARILGAVVNDLDLESREYGYYYYRRYGYYYGEKKHDAAA